MIKKGQSKGTYRGVPYEVARVPENKDRWYYSINGKDSLPDYWSGKRIALSIAHDEIDKMLATVEEDLCLKSWDAMCKEMSVAGSPKKITTACEKMMDIMYEALDRTNPAEITNLIFGIDKLKTHAIQEGKAYEQRTGQSIL